MPQIREFRLFLMLSPASATAHPLRMAPLLVMSPSACRSIVPRFSSRVVTVALPSVCILSRPPAKNVPVVSSNTRFWRVRKSTSRPAAMVPLVFEKLSTFTIALVSASIVPWFSSRAVVRSMFWPTIAALSLRIWSRTASPRLAPCATMTAPAVLCSCEAETVMSPALSSMAPLALSTVFAVMPSAPPAEICAAYLTSVSPSPSPSPSVAASVAASVAGSEALEFVSVLTPMVTSPSPRITLKARLFNVSAASCNAPPDIIMPPALLSMV
ncbi:hypothetical protein D3C87_1108170 [compost metagenome]